MMHWAFSKGTSQQTKNGINGWQCVWVVVVWVLPGGRGATPPGPRLWNQGSDSGDSPVPPCPSPPGRLSGLPKDGELSSCPWTGRWATGSQTRHWNSPLPWSLRSTRGGGLTIPGNYKPREVWGLFFSVLVEGPQKSTRHLKHTTPKLYHEEIIANMQCKLSFRLFTVHQNDDNLNKIHTRP